MKTKEIKTLLEANTILINSGVYSAKLDEVFEYLRYKSNKKETFLILAEQEEKKWK